MKIAIRFLLLAGLIGGGIWLWMYFHPGPEEAIRRRLADVAREVSFSGQEGMVARATHSQKLASYFGREVSLMIDLPELSSHEGMSRDEIAQLALMLRSSPAFRSLKVQCLDPVITLGADGKSAIVELTIRAETVGDKYLVVQEMKFTMKEVDGEWLILRVDTVKTLNRAPAPRWGNTPALV
jgi:hypothetical protein